MRIRAVAVAVDVTVTGLGADWTRGIEVGETVRLGWLGSCDLRVTRKDGSSALGGGVAYVLARDTSGACRLRHTGHVGRVELDGTLLPSKSFGADGLLVREGARLRFSFDDETVLELSYERERASEHDGLRVPGPNGPFGSLAHRRLARLAAARTRARTPYLVRVAGRSGEGFACEFFAEPPLERGVPAQPPHVVPTTEVYHGVTGFHLNARVLSSGDLGLARIQVGPRSDQTVGPVVQELRLFPADGLLIDGARRAREALLSLDFQPPHDDATLAALHAMTGGDATARSLQAELVAHALVERDALSLATVTSAARLIEAVVAILERHGLPRLFDAARALREASDPSRLFSDLIGELNIALATARDERRFVPVWFGDEREPTHARLSDHELARLLEAGLIRQSPGSG